MTNFNDTLELSPSEKVYRYVISMLQNGTWKVGDKIYTEEQFCEKLNVSRVATREALERFVAFGMLERRKGAGTFVQEFDMDNLMGHLMLIMSVKSVDVLDVLTFRRYFEPGNVREFMKQHTDQDIVELEDNYERMKKAADSGNLKRFAELDIEFHMIIARGTRNPILKGISEMFCGVQLSAQESAAALIGPSIGLQYHKELMQAMRQNDKHIAPLIMERHIEVTINDLLNKMKGNEEGDSGGTEKDVSGIKS